MNAGPILVIWHCDQGEACTNLEEPGVHRGDDGYTLCGICRGELKPAVKTKPIKMPELD